MFSNRAREVLTVGALVVLSLLVLRANARSPERLNWFDRLLLRATTPIQSSVARLGHSIVSSWRRYGALRGVEADNRQLADENRWLQAELDRARLAPLRVAELEQLLQFRNAIPSETLAARVVGIDTSPLYRVVRIRLDRGTDEVQPGMPVLSPTGIVGTVRRVFGGYCDVLLATDPESSADVVVLRRDAKGALNHAVQGLSRGVAGGDRYRARFLRTEEVSVGDRVVTSGADGVYPRDLPVGQVTQLTSPTSGLWREAEIAPSVDLSRLSEVLVVLAAPPPQPPEEGRRQSAPHHGLGAPR